MGCLYCGKSLTLLQRLRRAQPFCSNEHWSSYRKEYDELAVLRLGEAQAKAEGTIETIQESVSAAWEGPLQEVS